MHKPIPPPTLATVLPPNLEHDYFAEGAAHPFRPNAVRFQLVNAWWMAEASLLAYADAKFVRAQFQKVGFVVSDGQPFFDREHGTQCYVAHNDHVVLVIFRGTEVRKLGVGQEPAEAWRAVLKDWQSDLQFRLVPSMFGGAVHQGFARALDTLWREQVEPYMEALKLNKPTRLVWLTGHSLGGALATLAADRLEAAQGLYTFGSPLVGDAAFAADFHVNAYRLVNHNDIVTRVPQWGPYGVNLFKWGSYEHVGLLTYIDEQGVLHDNPRLWKRVRHGLFGGLDHIWDIGSFWAKGEFSMIPFDCLNDHAPLYYALRLWNAYDEEAQDA